MNLKSIYDYYNYIYGYILRSSVIYTKKTNQIPFEETISLIHIYISLYKILNKKKFFPSHIFFKMLHFIIHEWHYKSKIVYDSLIFISNLARGDLSLSLRARVSCFTTMIAFLFGQDRPTSFPRPRVHQELSISFKKLQLTSNFHKN